MKLLLPSCNSFGIDQTLETSAILPYIDLIFISTHLRLSEHVVHRLQFGICVRMRLGQSFDQHIVDIAVRCARHL